MRRLPLAAAALAFLAAFALVSAVQVQYPLSLGDYAGNWGLKARTLFSSGDLTRTFAVDPAAEFSHPEYPPAWPMLLAGVSSIAGRYDEYLLAFLRPLLTLVVAGLVARRTEAPAPLRAVAATAVCLLPYFQDPAYAGYAEPLLLVFLLAGLSLLEAPSASPLAHVGGALFLALAALTKNEGAVAALVASVALLAGGRRRAALLSAGATLAAAGGWALFTSRHLAVSLVDFTADAFSTSKLLAAAREIAAGQALPLLPWLAGAAAILSLAPATVSRRRIPLLAAAVYSLLLFCSYAFTRLETAYHARNSWDRLVLVPVVVVFLPLLAEALLEAIEPIAPAREGRPWVRPGQNGRPRKT